MFEENPVTIPAHCLGRRRKPAKTAEMKKIITLAIAVSLLAGCNSANNQRPSAKYEEKKSSVEEMERESPLKFLKVTGSHHGNLLNQTVLEGDVANKATMVSYKNVTLQISYHDESGSVIEKQKKVLDDVMKPGSTNDFKIKTSHIKGATSVTFDIVDATADK